MEQDARAVVGATAGAAATPGPLGGVCPTCLLVSWGVPVCPRCANALLPTHRAPGPGRPLPVRPADPHPAPPPLLRVTGAPSMPAPAPPAGRLAPPVGALAPPPRGASTPPPARRPPPPRARRPPPPPPLPPPPAGWAAATPPPAGRATATPLLPPPPPAGRAPATPLAAAKQPAPCAQPSARAQRVVAAQIPAEPPPAPPAAADWLGPLVTGWLEPHPGATSTTGEPHVQPDRSPAPSPAGGRPGTAPGGPRRSHAPRPPTMDTAELVALAVALGAAAGPGSADAGAGTGAPGNAPPAPGTAGSSDAGTDGASGRRLAGDARAADRQPESKGPDGTGAVRDTTLFGHRRGGASVPRLSTRPRGRRRPLSRTLVAAAVAAAVVLGALGAHALLSSGTISAPSAHAGGHVDAADQPAPAAAGAELGTIPPTSNFGASGQGAGATEAFHPSGVWSLRYQVTCSGSQPATASFSVIEGTTTVAGFDTSVVGSASGARTGLPSAVVSVTVAVPSACTWAFQATVPAAAQPGTSGTAPVTAG